MQCGLVLLNLLGQLGPEISHSLWRKLHSGFGEEGWELRGQVCASVWVCVCGVCVWVCVGVGVYERVHMYMSDTYLYVVTMVTVPTSSCWLKNFLREWHTTSQYLSLSTSLPRPPAYTHQLSRCHNNSRSRERVPHPQHIQKCLYM